MGAVGSFEHIWAGFGNLRTLRKPKKPGGTDGRRHGHEFVPLKNQNAINAWFFQLFTPNLRTVTSWGPHLPQFEYTILCYSILCYTRLYYNILYYTMLYYTILWYTILYYTLLYYTILYYTITGHIFWSGCHRGPTGGHGGPREATNGSQILEPGKQILVSRNDI